MQTEKVFSSSIVRGQDVLNNNLYDLINIVPAKTACAVSSHEEKEYCDFRPNVDKLYIPKKRSRMKVKTVRDIRNVFEKDVYSYLPENLKRQQNFLLRKITGGAAKISQTITLAKKILNSDNSLSRTSWQMLMNVNPEDKINSTQFVLWNGKRIRVTGSRGGKNKFLSNYDLAKKHVPTINKSVKNKKYVNNKKGLLRNSLSIKFKPGPLTKKKYLDDSYQKFNVGGSDLIHLPQIGLEIKPTLGVPLEPTIMNVLRYYRNDEGIISSKWAEFSVSTLRTVKTADSTLTGSPENVTFELKYKSNQRRILVRHGVRKKYVPNMEQVSVNISNGYDTDEVMPEVRTILNDILESVEISLQQDSMYTGEDDIREIVKEDLFKEDNCVPSKEKPKRKLNELDRLDVTIIRLPDTNLADESNGPCQKSYCSLGCICNSLKCNYALKQHCGNAECMFECKCDFLKYKVTDTFENQCPELLPGLLNLDNEINLRLAKEEQKFHQTVVLTGEKSILLKSQKRNWKASKRYSDFYSNMSLKSEVKPDRILTVTAVKLSCDNVEPWCMVHNLYRCFCKGKFTNRFVPNKAQEEKASLKIDDKVINKNEEKASNKNDDIVNKSEEKVVAAGNDIDPKNLLKVYSRPERSRIAPKKYLFSETSDVIAQECTDCSARIRQYSGRKYEASYYANTNDRIMEMEKNDLKLYKRLTNLIQQSENFEKSTLEHITGNAETQINATTNDYDNVKHEEESDWNDIDSAPGPSLQIKSKLKRWLVTSYKNYKERVQQGITKTSLDPPKPGKLALYPWEFILSRYRERKNLFMISEKTPFRIFMAVDVNDTFFEKCININHIRFVDLYKYPATIKNLLTNATDIKHTFFILCGLHSCWELIGSVKKIEENSSTEEISNSESSSVLDGPNNESIIRPIDDDGKNNDSDYVMFDWDNDSESNNETETSKDISRWFVMTVEKDFCEIQFFNRGFFVKYESIIRAINVARLSSKAVRLSAQKSIEQNGEPMFGLYAIPNVNEYCVFVGPYDKDEPLGIETVKSFSHANAVKRTRGVWMTTKKMDNMKVIDNPLSFLPPEEFSKDPTKIVSLGSGLSDQHKQTDICKDPKTSELMETSQNAAVLKKMVKPIKIPKSNGFFHIVKALHNGQNNNRNSLLLNSSLVNPITNISPTKIKSLSTSATIQKVHPNMVIECISRRPIQKGETKKPIAEIAPQVKIAEVYSEAGKSSAGKPTKRLEGGMFILKPEEINKKLMLKTDIGTEIYSTPNQLTSISSVDQMDEDIENFLATSEVCDPPNADVYVISDDEDELTNSNNKDVWIECTNVENLGWIRGKQNAEKELSFEFPGFKFTDFYHEEEAFAKINQVLSRKIYIPKNLKLIWHVVESEDKLGTKTKLATDKLGSDYVLTKKGPRHKIDLVKFKDVIAVFSDKTANDDPKPMDVTGYLSSFEPQTLDETGASSSFTAWEKESTSLETECELLMSEFMKKGELIKSLYNQSIADQSASVTLIKNTSLEPAEMNN